MIDLNLEPCLSCGCDVSEDQYDYELELCRSCASKFKESKPLKRSQDNE